MDWEKIFAELKAKFGLADEKIILQRKMRAWVEADAKISQELISFLREKFGFTILLTITGLDAGDSFQVKYHLTCDNGAVFTVTALLQKEHPAIASLTPIFKNAELYERELIDLLGIDVTGLGEGFRYPMPEGWPKNQNPLRKDWKKESSAGVKSDV